MAFHLVDMAFGVFELVPTLSDARRNSSETPHPSLLLLFVGNESRHVVSARQESDVVRSYGGRGEDENRHQYKLIDQVFLQ